MKSWYLWWGSVRSWSESTKKGSKRVFPVNSLYFHSLANGSLMTPLVCVMHVSVTSHQTSDLGQCSAFFSWEPTDNLLRKLMGKLLSMKESDCTIFHIFPGTFWCAGQNFRDYFFIWTFSPQQLMRLGWNLARSFPQHICAFSDHFLSHQWIFIFIGGLWLSTTVVTLNTLVWDQAEHWRGSSCSWVWARAKSERWSWRWQRIRISLLKAEACWCCGLMWWQ